MRASLLATGLILLVGAGIAHTTGSPSQGNLVLREPMEGDTAHYQTTLTTENTTGHRVEELSINWTQTWTTQTVLTPNVREQTFPSIQQTTARVLHGATEAGLEESHPGLNLELAERWEPGQRRTFYLQEIPGAPVLVSANETVVNRSGQDLHRFNETRRVVSNCTGPPVTRLVGTPAEEARAILSRCGLAEAGSGRSQVEAHWDAHERWGRTWMAEQEIPTAATTLGPVRISLRVSPAISMPLERTWGWTHENQGEVHRHQLRTRVQGWRPGSGPLPPGPPIEDQVQLPLTNWTKQGPQTGGIDRFPFQRAYERLIENRDVEAYLSDHPDAHLSEITFIERSGKPTNPGIESDGGRDRCRNTQSPSNPRTQLPEGDDALVWAMSWSAEGENLEASISKREDAPRTPLQRTSPAVDTDVRRIASQETLPALDLPARGPSPTGLRERVDMADALGLRGDPFVRLTAASGATEGKPANRSEPAGVVGRIQCAWDPVSHDYAIRQAGIIFKEGEPRATFRLDFLDRSPEGLGLDSLSDPPQAGESAGDDLGAGSLGFAGVAFLVTGLAISTGSHLGGSLYADLSDDEVLAHSTRRRLLDLIKNRPCPCINDLCEAVEEPRSTIRHHLYILERHGFIALQQTDAGTVAYPPGSPLAGYAELLARDRIPDLLQAIARESGGSVTGIANTLSLSEGYVSRLLGELEEADLVQRERDGRSVRFRLSDQARSLDVGWSSEPADRQ